MVEVTGVEVMGNSASADELEERLIDFAVRVINVADKLPKTGWLLRSSGLADREAP